MDDRRAPAVLASALLLLLAVMVNVVAGLHYANADGGDPVRTHGNHLGGWIHLGTAAVVLAGVVWILRRSSRPRLVVLAVLMALTVAVGGFAAGQAAIRNGGNCACEGG